MASGAGSAVLLTKFVVAPVAMAAIGYFLVGPHIGKGLFGKPLTSATPAVSAPSTESGAKADVPAADKVENGAKADKPASDGVEPPIAEVKVTPAEPNAPNVGADSDATSVAAPIPRNAEPPHRRRRRRKAHRHILPPAATGPDSTTTPPSSPTQPIDDGGSAGGDGTGN